MRPGESFDPLAVTRRHFLSSASLGLGGLALGALLPRDLSAGTTRGVLPALLAALGRPRPEGEGWHTVPRLLAGKREHADAFAKAWDRWVGGGEAMYAKTPEAEGVLVTHRGEDPFAATCVIRRVWE